jgi:hypothetical protein
MKRFTVLPFAACMLLLVGDARVMGQEKKPKSALRLKLECVQGTVPAGTAPVLRLTIENTGTADERVLKPRGDLQDSYYDLVVTKDGKALNLGRAISDPGPISDPDFLTLKPGGKVTFEFSRYAVAVHDLPPGSYQAQIHFWQDPFKSHTTAVLSPAAAFTVGK